MNNMIIFMLDSRKEVKELLKEVLVVQIVESRNSPNQMCKSKTKNQKHNRARRKKVDQLRGVQ